jgi:hypothetical protein
MKRAILAVSVLALAFGFILLRVWYCCVYDWDRDVANQERIGRAYVCYYAERHEFAASLSNLVSAGYLPEKASYYQEPPGFWNLKEDSKSTCYAVFAPLGTDIQQLRFIGRKTSDGAWVFEPTPNAIVRDDILALQRSSHPQ